MSLFLTELVVRPYRQTALCDGRNWVLYYPMIYQSDLLGQIVVPKSFVTDFASTPQALWTQLPPWGDYGPAAVVHDYLYAEQPCTREQADDVLLEAMGVLNVGELTRQLIYQGVRLGGQPGWDEDAKRKAAGLPHIST